MSKIGQVRLDQLRYKAQQIIKTFMEVKKYKLGECLELQRGYDLTSSQMQGGKVAVVGSNGIIGYHNEERGNSPCITVGRSGSVGKVHYYEQPTWSHNTALFVKDFKGNNPKYLYYFLKNLHLDKMFEKGSSVIPSLDRKVVHSLVVPFHKDINDQRKIVAVLSAIDAKIELNHQINDNLRASRAQSQTQFELCRGAAVNADVSPNLPMLDRSLRRARVRLAV